VEAAKEDYKKLTEAYAEHLGLREKQATYTGAP
jgi:hypothetical protein